MGKCLCFNIKGFSPYVGKINVEITDMNVDRKSFYRSSHIYYNYNHHSFDDIFRLIKYLVLVTE